MPEIPAPQHREPNSRFGLMSILDWIALAFCVGFAAGTVSSLGWFARSYLDSYVGPVSWNTHMLWMPVISESVFTLAIIVALSPLALILPARSFHFIIAGLTTFTVSFAVLGHSGFLALWAIVILSLGIAVRAAVTFQKHSAAILRTCRLFMPFGVAIVLLTVGSIYGSRTWREHRALSALVPAPAEAPHILFVVWDTVRADYVGTIEQGGAPTPHLSHLAERGIAFERAIAPASWTLPSHTSMFTGLFPHEFDASFFTPIDRRKTMLAEVLQGRGYQTGAFVANWGYCGCGTGLNQGFTHYDDRFKVNLHRIFLCNLFYRHVWLDREPNKFKTGTEITDDFTDWMQTVRSDRPFFAFLNYMDAHTPYLPETIDGRPLTDREAALMWKFENMAPETIGRDLHDLARQCYRAQITALDTELGRLMTALRKNDALENTVVIVVSDHGEQFGEHGHYLHGNSLYKPLVHVPLVVSCPGDAVRGQRVKTSVSLRNVAATVLHCAGELEDSAIRGRSLLDIAKREREGNLQFTPQQEPVYAYSSMKDLKENSFHSPLPMNESAIGWKGRIDLWVDDSYFLLLGPDDSLEMYDVERDPRETRDLTQDNELLSQLSRMRTQLERFLKGHARDEAQATRGGEPDETGPVETVHSIP